MRSQVQAYTAAVAIGVLMTSLVHGQGSSEPPPAYTPPGGKKMFHPGYNDELRKAGQEAWVLLTLMVDRKGKAYEVAVVDSSGFESLENSAVAIMDRAEFQPAKLGNREVDSVHRMTFTWRLDAGGRTPPTSGFEDSFKLALTAIDKGDRQRADELLASLKATTVHDDAWRNVLLHVYYKRWGTSAQQLAALRRASGLQDRNYYLHPGRFDDTLRQRLELEIQLGDFGGALQAWEIIAKAKKTEEFAKTFQAAIDDIHARRSDDRSHTLAGEVDHRGSWFVQLLKRRFAIEVPNSKVSHLKLRCERGFFSYEFEAGKQYETDENAGACQLQVIGEAGTAFELQQS